MPTNEQIVARALILAKGMPRVQIEVPVNACPHEDPPGESPTKLVWAEDMSATVAAVIEALEAAGRLIPDEAEVVEEWGWSSAFESSGTEYEWDGGMTREEAELRVEALNAGEADEEPDVRLRYTVRSRPLLEWYGPWVEVSGE